MKICTTWITRTYAQDTPELICAWGEYDIDGNYDGWRDDRQAQIDAIGKDLHTFRDIDIEVDYEAVQAIFADQTLQGKVEAA